MELVFEHMIYYFHYIYFIFRLPYEG